jgi:hypothetical protein
MSLPVMEEGDIWLFENEWTNNPLEDEYLGPVLIVKWECNEQDHDGYVLRRDYEALDLLTGDYTGVRVDTGNYKYWRQLA